MAEPSQAATPAPQCGTSGIGVVSLDFVLGNSDWWRKNIEDRMRQDGHLVSHVDIFLKGVEGERPPPTWWELITTDVNDIVAGLNWGSALRQIDATVGELHENGCQEIYGIGPGLGGVYLLLYTNGAGTNESEAEDGWFPALVNSHLMTKVAAVYPHLEYPLPVTDKERHPPDYATTPIPTLIAIGGADVHIVPLTGNHDTILSAVWMNPLLQVKEYSDAEDLFAHEDLPHVWPEFIIRPAIDMEYNPEQARLMLTDVFNFLFSPRE